MSAATPSAAGLPAAPADTPGSAPRLDPSGEQRRRAFDSIAGLLGQVGAELFQRLFLAHLAGGHRA